MNDNNMKNTKTLYSKYITFPFLLMMLTIIVSCNREEIDIVTVDVNTEPPKMYHDNNFIGKVTNERGIALNEATIEINGSLYFTDQNGFYRIINKRVNKNGALIKVSAPNYYSAFQFNRQDTDEIGINHFQLIPMSDFTQVDNTKDLTISVTDEVDIIIEANSFKSTGDITFGKTLRLYVKYLDPDHDHVRKLFPLFMPFKDNILDLKNTDLLLFHVTDERGAALDIQKPIKVVVKSVNQENREFLTIGQSADTWVKAGEMVKESGKMTLSINKNGYYAIADTYEACLTTFDIRSRSGLDVFNATLQIIQESAGAGVNRVSNQAGKWTGFLKKNETYKIQIKNSCDELIFSKILNIGSSDQMVEKIEIDDVLIRTLKHNLKSCNNNNLSLSDQISVVMQSPDEKIALILEESNKLIAFISCQDISSMAVYQNDHLKWIETNLVIDTENSSKQSLLLTSEDVCINEIGGWVNIAGKIKLFNKQDLIVLYAPPGSSTLEIADINNFTFSFSISSVEGPGKYKPETLVFNVPVPVFCERNNCNNVEINIRKIEGKDKPVIMDLGGFVEGLPIMGSFERELFN